jgi:ABC-2 type transport system ATP-binding protein
MKAVEINNLVKRYGYIEALKGINLEVSQNEIFALVGPNGAGKTTTFKIVSTLLLPTSGQVKVFGYDVVNEADKVRKMISYLPEEAGVYKNITGYEYLDLIAYTYFGNSSEYSKALELGIEIAGLGNRIHDKMKSYSKGMKRRIQLARTLMTKPKLAILDEPTTGVDFEYAYEIRKIILEYNKKFNITFMVSSHNLREVEVISSKIAIIKDGIILKTGKIDNLLEVYKANNVEDLYIKIIKGA